MSIAAHFLKVRVKRTCSSQLVNTGFFSLIRLEVDTMPPFWHHHLPFFFFPHANFTNATHPFFFPHFNSTNATNPFFFPHANSTNTTATGSALNLPAQTTDAEYVLHFRWLKRFIDTCQDYAHVYRLRSLFL